MEVHMIAIDPESELDAVPFASEEDAKRHCEDYFRDYLKDMKITDVTFEWRPEEPPWQDVRALYVVNSSVSDQPARQPCLLWAAQVHTYLTAAKEVEHD